MRHDTTHPAVQLKRSRRLERLQPLKRLELSEQLERLEPGKPKRVLHSVIPLLIMILLVNIVIGGCRQKMADQPHQRPLEPSGFFDDGMASRPAVPGTVPRTGGEQNTYLLTGKIGGQPGNALPFPVTLDLLERGRERYEIFCSPCHDRLGTGQGMIVRRGFTPARSFHEPRVREAPAGHYFEVMTRGFGTMPSYANQVSPRDRWAIIAYIRALQLSRSARVDELPPEDRARLSKEAK